MSGFPILSLMILLPIAAAAICLFLSDQGARWVALATTALLFVLGILLWVNYEIGGPQWQFVENAPIFGRFAWALGIDGIALMLIMLSVFLMPICVLASWDAIEKRVPEYMAAFLMMESFMIGVFAAQDLFLFYIFFEAGLIPMYLIIGIWGGVERIKASYKFFLYTLLGSVLMLVAMMYMVATAGTTDIPTLMQFNFDPAVQNWLWLAFFASFAVKMPMWPVHTWLPDAHVQAPTAGSVILAGVLLKMGGYGFVRFSLPMFPDASAALVWVVFGLSMVAIVYTSLVALVQQDMKKLIAYSSVAHMGFVTIGLFTFNRQGIEGGLIVMLAHGLVSAALFLCVGVIYDRLHTREIDRYGGLSNNMPYYALFFMFFTMASVGLPGTANFVGEFLALVGAYNANSWVAAVATTGIILGAAYMLWLYRRVAFGESKNADAAAMPDLNAREWV
ncbi:MAG: NADH-quinone oxidoreductase subunit M, partial [Sphingomonadaceae bacterium]|nr:NADH-quinone oxidoreductase subunit M [Sphingomonadaceae bacterium]